VTEQQAVRRRDAEATKQRILQSALKNFGRYGYTGASLRKIVADADANVAAANYYFGSKAKLLVATIDHYIVQTQARRIELLQETRALPAGKERLRALIAAYLRPHFEITLAEGNQDYARLLTKVVTEENLTLQTEIDRALLPVRQRFRDELALCFPDIERSLLARAVGLTVAVLTIGPYGIDPRTLAFRGLRKEPMEQALEQATRFTFGGVVELLGLK